MVLNHFTMLNDIDTIEAIVNNGLTEDIEIYIDDTEELEEIIEFFTEHDIYVVDEEYSSYKFTQMYDDNSGKMVYICLD